MKYKGMIFDFNGVLLWDTHLHEKAWMDFSSPLREFPLSAEEIFQHVHGRRNRHILEYLLERPISEMELITLSSKKEALYRSLCLQNRAEFQLSPGAINLLDFLVENDIPHAIATASEKDNVDFFIEHLNLGKWFDLSTIACDDGCFPSKREIFIRAAEKLNLAPEQCIVIEDSKAGIAAATQAKIGKIIGLGPKEMHPWLIALEGVSAAITSLNEIEKERIFEFSNP